MVELHTISYLLHPPLLDESGLSPAIRWFVGGFSKRSGIQVEADVPEEIGRLPEEIEIALFRVLQEALTNVHRHSGSATARIRLRLDPDQVTLEVKDEGRGIVAPVPHHTGDAGIMPGVGLAGMRERVQQLGGQLKLQSDGKGTLVQVILPVAKVAAAQAGPPPGPASR
jgi:signal transduction histidine kinase